VAIAFVDVGVGGTNFIFTIKEQETRLTLQEHDDDDDDDDDVFNLMPIPSSLFLT